jgi:hypothetical protein
VGFGLIFLPNLLVLKPRCSSAVTWIVADTRFDVLSAFSFVLFLLSLKNNLLNFDLSYFHESTNQIDDEAILLTANPLF